MEILNTYLVYDETINTITLILFVGFICCLGIMITNLIFKNFKTVLIWLIISVFSFGLFFCSAKWWENTGTKCYETIITDMNKLDLDKYKIIDKRGKIIVIQEVNKK